MIRINPVLIILLGTSLLTLSVGVNHIVVQKFGCVVQDPGLVLWYDISLVWSLVVFVGTVSAMHHYYRAYLDKIIGPENIILHPKEKSIDVKDIKRFRKAQEKGPHRIKVVVK